MGEEVIPEKFELVDDFSEGVAAVFPSTDGHGYINRKGEMVIHTESDGCVTFLEGLAPIKVDGKYFSIDKNGNKANSFQYDFAEPYYNGLSLVTVGKNIFH